MRLDTDTTQLWSDTEEIWLNINNIEPYGIGVTVYPYQATVYLLKEGNFISFVTFAREKDAKEYFEELDRQGRVVEILWEYSPE